MGTGEPPGVRSPTKWRRFRGAGAASRNPERSRGISTPILKDHEVNASQLNRLVWLTFIVSCFRFQPYYFGFSSAHSCQHLSSAPPKFWRQKKLALPQLSF